MNCFQISIFAVHEQQRSYIELRHAVVNCFQISIFAVHEQQYLCLRIAAAGCELLSN